MRSKFSQSQNLIMCVQSLTEAGGISYDVIDNSAFNAEAYNLLFNNFRAT